jgi:bifunctional non-homologous end joining protein LigD
MAYIKAGNRKLEISNEDKVFFPESKITKGDLIDYYKQAGEMIIPHMKDRPLTMRRFPALIYAINLFCLLSDNISGFLVPPQAEKTRMAQLAV